MHVWSTDMHTNLPVKDMYTYIGLHYVSVHSRGNMNKGKGTIGEVEAKILDNHGSTIQVFPRAVKNAISYFIHLY